MKPTTRLRILDHIRKSQSISAIELSRFLGMTAANIRHHLAILEANDLVEVVEQRCEGRGRPMNVYALSRRMLGDGLDELASGLLETWFVGLEKRMQQECLRLVAEKMAGEQNEVANRSIPRRLAGAVNRMNELHYHSRWEASASGPRLILGHCPYAAIILNHPELCQLDKYLLEAQLWMLVEQTEKLQPSAKGLPFCAFVVRGKL